MAESFPARGARKHPTDSRVARRARIAKAVVLVCALLECASTAWAREDVVPGSRYTSGRAAAMGDAGLPMAQDAGAALFYNPAALARLRGVTFDPWNVQLQGNSDFVRTLDQNGYNVFSLKKYRKTLNANPYAVPRAAFAALPAFSVGPLGFGVLYQNEVGASNQGAVIKYRARTQLIPAAGFAWRMASGVVRLGYSLQYVNQSISEGEAPTSGTPISYKLNSRAGAGLSHTAGVALTLPWQYLPSFNLVVRNLLGTKYGASPVRSLLTSESVGVPDTEAMSMDGSFSFENKLGMGATTTYVVQLRDALNSSQTGLLTRFALGTEFNFRSKFFLRGGVGGGYFHAGAGFRAGGAEMLGAWYTEELGHGFRDSADTRYVLQFVIKAL